MPTSRRSIGAVLLASLAFPTIAIAEPAADAELIRLCDLMVVNQTEYMRLCAKDDTDEVEDRIDELSPVWRETIEALLTMTPTTMAGVQAVARAVMVNAQFEDDGDIYITDAPQQLAFKLVGWMAEGRFAA